MADTLESASSAAIVLEPEPEAPISPSTKRPRSASPEPAPKRARLSQDGTADSPSTARASPPAVEPEKQAREEMALDPLQARRKSSAIEEKQRGKRLFGGLLSALSRTTPDGSQKRREEAEKRQAAKAQQLEVEAKAREAEMLEKRAKLRKAQQIKWDENSMRTRHANMLAIANFLPTRSKPKLYYKPWKLLPANEDRIKAQKVEVDALVGREIDDFYNQHPHLARPEKVVPDESEPEGDRKANDTSKETEGEPEAESPSVSNAPVDTTNIPVQEQAAEKELIEEHNGEVVVEGEEDTVIY